MRRAGIYKIESKIKPYKIYIGSAVDLDGRKRSHLSRLRKNKHHSPKLQSHYNKYGESDLCFSIIYLCNPDELIRNEQHYIDLYKPFFNICMVAGNSLGVKHSDEYKNKIRAVTTGKKASEETKRKMSESQKRIGNKPPSGWGRIKSIETRAKLSIANKGKSPSIETREKISNKLKGLTISEDTKKKISEKLKGRLTWNKGKKGIFTKEQRAIMSEASKQYWQSKKKTA